MDPMGFYEVDNFVDYCEQEHKGNYETAFADWRIASERRKAERRASYNWMPWNLLKVRTSLNYPRFCLNFGCALVTCSTPCFLLTCCQHIDPGTNTDAKRCGCSELVIQSRGTTG